MVLSAPSLYFHENDSVQSFDEGACVGPGAVSKLVSV